MEPFHSLTVVEQLAAYLRVSISKGDLRGGMPGIRSLAATLGVSSNTVAAAVEQLGREGFLQPQGHGRRSRIVLPEDAEKPRFRVTLLPYERVDAHLDHVVEIQLRLRQEGHEVRVAEKSLVELGLSVGRVARMVAKTKTDAWIVLSSPQEILEWFVSCGIPTFALFGRFRRLPMAASGLDKVPAFRTAIRRLVELGHRRIVLLQPKHNREPRPALLVREAIAEMEAHGIRTGDYNLPDWEQSPAGLRKRLDSLFAVSPPTAIILDRPNELIGAQIHLAHRGILAPRDVSLICDDDPAFEWCKPSVSCVRWKTGPWVRRVSAWVNNVAKGKEDLRQSFTKAEFVERETVGSAPERKSTSGDMKPQP